MHPRWILNPIPLAPPVEAGNCQHGLPHWGLTLSCVCSFCKCCDILPYILAHVALLFKCQSRISLLLWLRTSPPFFLGGVVFVLFFAVAVFMFVCLFIETRLLCIAWLSLTLFVDQAVLEFAEIHLPLPFRVLGLQACTNAMGKDIHSAPFL